MLEKEQVKEIEAPVEEKKNNYVENEIIRK